MEVFATFDDVKARYPAASTRNRETVETLISDASALMQASAPKLTDNKRLLCFVCCSVVRRALAAAENVGEMTGVSQTSQTVGAFSQSWSFTNPAGDLYLTRAEKRLIRGQGAQTGFHVIMGDSDER